MGQTVHRKTVGRDHGVDRARRGLRRRSRSSEGIPSARRSWHIEGVKRFITSGEHDLSDNIITTCWRARSVSRAPEGPAPRA